MRQLMMWGAVLAVASLSDGQGLDPVFVPVGTNVYYSRLSSFTWDAAEFTSDNCDVLSANYMSWNGAVYHGECSMPFSDGNGGVSWYTGETANPTYGPSGQGVCWLGITFNPFYEVSYYTNGNGDNLGKAQNVRSVQTLQILGVTIFPSPFLVSHVNGGWAECPSDIVVQTIFQETCPYANMYLSGHYCYCEGSHYWDGFGCELIEMAFVDLSGEGLDLSSSLDGVPLDPRASGRKQFVSWTKVGSKNGFLVLDGPTGPGSARPITLKDLALHDAPDKGGNADGLIDSRDSVFSRLHLWTDQSHDGIVALSELHGLSELGISTIELSYGSRSFDDRHGNRFQNRARIRRVIDGVSSDTWVYGVQLAPATNGGGVLARPGVPPTKRIPGNIQ